MISLGRKPLRSPASLDGKKIATAGIPYQDAYLKTILDEILSGKLQRGQTRVFHVGVDENVGAEICEPTPEQSTKMEEAYALIASGDLNEAFGKVKAEAYA